MHNLSLSTRVEQAQKLLASLHEQIPHLPPECQNAICADLAHVSETITRYGFPNPAAHPADLPPAAEIRPEYRMGMVLRKAHAGVFMRDLVNKTVKWSPELYELLGIDPATSSQSATFMSMIHPDDIDRVQRDTQAAIDQGGSYYQEFRVIRPDGEVIWLSSIGYVEHDPSGCPLTLTGINQDITTRKQAEQAREKAHQEAVEEKKRLEAVMEALPIGVAILNNQGETIQANSGYDEVWGSPRPETHSVDDFSSYKAWLVEDHHLLAAEEWAAAQALQTGKTTINQFLEIERFDGSRRFVFNSAAPIHGENGQVTGCAVAIRDITERVLAERALVKSEQALRESEERLRVVLAALPITAYMLDRDLRYTWIYNPQLGMTEEKMLGKRDDEIFPGGAPQLVARLRAVLETGQGFQHEVKTGIFGSEKSFLLSVEPLMDLEGCPTGLIGAGMDITAQRQLETQTREAFRQVEQQRKIIENRERERQEIAREIHDGPIQTLVSMMFNNQLSRDVFAQAAVPDEVLDVLDKTNQSLKSAVRELRDVVNNLRPPALLRFGLGKTLQAYVEDFRDKHPELTLDLAFDLPDDEIYFSEEISLSVYRLCQEGLNNVVRHAQAAQAAIRFTKKGKKIILEIKDDGKGFRVPKDLSQPMKQDHYGLAGMAERVQAIGGALKIRSGPGRGTQVRITIPME